MLRRSCLPSSPWRGILGSDDPPPAVPASPARLRRSCNNSAMNPSWLRRLGRSDLQVSPLCLGGNVFGWTVDEALSFRLLDAWVDAGLNFIDTADVYSRWVHGHAGSESESILGKWFRQ